MWVYSNQQYNNSDKNRRRWCESKNVNIHIEFSNLMKFSVRHVNYSLRRNYYAFFIKMLCNYQIYYRKDDRNY